MTYVPTNALIVLVQKYGLHNLTFKMKARPIREIGGLIAYTTSSDPQIEVNTYITEEQYKVDEGHKVTLTPYAPSFPKENFYQSDLISLIRQGSVKIEDSNGNPIDL
jgi:hypothetical protein